MQAKQTRSLKILSLLMVFCLSQFSFTTRYGADHFSIFLNGKLVMEEYVSTNRPLKTLVLRQDNYNDKVEIFYSHCGRIGKARTITLKDGQDKILKEWQFADSNGDQNGMTCKAKEILELQQKKGVDKVKLFYASNFFPEGRLLAQITLAKDNRTTP